MPYANLPPGCSSLKFEDGSVAKATRPGGRAFLSDAQASAVDRMSGNGTAGLVTGNAGYRVHGGPWRDCTRCGRRWHAFTAKCHACKAPTGPMQGR